MAHGVCPQIDGTLLNGKEEKEEVFEDALMEATVDESETAAAAAAKEKPTLDNAEVSGSTEEAKQDEGWQQQQARRRRAPTPSKPPLETKPLEYGWLISRATRTTSRSDGEDRRAEGGEVVRSARNGRVSLSQVVRVAPPDNGSGPHSCECE